MKKIKANKKKLFKFLGYQSHPGQQEVHDSVARFRTAVCGRRWGKSLMAAHEALAEMIKPDSRGWVVAPTYDLAYKVFRETYWTSKKKMPDWISRTSESRQFIEFKNGSFIEAKSADNPDSLVGEGLNFLIIDEAARIKESVWTECLRPTLSDRKGWALFISTPRGRNWFNRAYATGMDKLWPDFESWLFPSSSNPYLDPEEIEQARMTLPERVFQQEYLAMFLDDAGGVFRNVRSCIKGTLGSPEPGHQYAIGVDLAKYQDFTVITVLDLDNGHLIYFDRFNKIDWSIQKKRIVNVAEIYPGTVIIDSTGVGDPIYEDLYARGDITVEPYKFTNESKKRLIDKLAMMIEKNEVSFPEIPELINELEIYQYEMTSAGNLRFNAPSGYHDDCVISLGLACMGFEFSGPPLDEWRF